MTMIIHPENGEICPDCINPDGNNNNQLKEIEKKIAELQARCCIPTGTIMVFSRPKPPKGWLVCDGTSLSWKEYPELFEVIEFYFGKGDCPGTFRVPDLRGQFLRGYPGGDCDPCREFGSRQGDAIRDIQGHFGRVIYDGSTGTVYEADNWGGGNNRIKWTDGAFNHDLRDGYATAIKTLTTSQYVSQSGKYPKSFEFKASNVVPTAKENRPVNISLLFCIKT